MLVQGLLAAFVDYIKQRKTVGLEELAAEFGLRVQVRRLTLFDCLITALSAAVRRRAGTPQPA